MQMIRGVFLVLFLTTAGCGVGEYNKRMQASLADSERTAAFNLNLYPTFTELDDKKRPKPGVSFRLPLVFDASANNAAGQPPVMALPGLWYGMEKIAPDPSGKNLAVYCGFSWVPKGDKKEADFQAEMKSLLDASLPGSRWQEVSLASPEGPPVALKMLEGKGVQDFKSGAAPKPAAPAGETTEGTDPAAEQAASPASPPQKVEGIFRLYLIPASNDYVLIAWRASAANASFWKSVETAMGTVKIEQLAAPAKAGKAAPPPAS